MNSEAAAAAAAATNVTVAAEVYWTLFREEPPRASDECLCQEDIRSVNVYVSVGVCVPIEQRRRIQAGWFLFLCWP